MKILGIHDGHNAAAALLVDGRVVSAVQEERFNRVKNWSGFPRQSIEWILGEAQLSPTDLDAVAMASLHVPYPKTQQELLAEYAASGSVRTYARRLAKSTPARKLHEERRRKERLQDVVAAGLPLDRVEFVEHHTAHAAAAYYGWGRYDDPVLVLTNDGAGDGLCASVSIGDGGHLTRISEVEESESIGNIYAVITFLMGMVPLEHEYKLMGMAPYSPEKGRGVVRDQLGPLMRFVPADGMRWQRSGGLPPTYYSYEFFRKKLALKRFDWVCAGLQAWTEEMLTEWVRNCIQATGIQKVALSGGVFMNVKANKMISELPDVEELFVFPSCGDETNAIGAAYWVEARNGADGSSIPPLRDLYLGPDYDDAEIKKVLEAHPNGGWSHERRENIASDAAELLANGEVVARCTGRAEFGARALGNRSIMADPSRSDVVRVINDMIKSRDFWMPFAPAILEPRADDYLVNPKRLFAPYMILSFDTTDRVNELRAAIHPYDLTARPQVVRRDWNPAFYEIIEEFDNRTGRGVILNTSFNLHGYPIVNSPSDAIQVLEESGLRHLLLGSFLLEKRD